MKTMKRLVMTVAFGAVLALASNPAFALGRGHKSNHSWSQNNGAGVSVADNTNNDCTPGTPHDSNPVPEPASLVLFGSALAGLGGYRGLRDRFLKKK